MKKVWIIINRIYGKEDDEIQGVFLKKESAEKFAKKLIIENDGLWWNKIIIEEHELRED